ncbi:MAG: hypothetical protein AB7V07_01850 [Candidatus Delongbacteria bacterium]
MADEKITKNEVEKRIEDWEKRLKDFFAFIKEWLKLIPSYTTKEDSETIMYEEMMQTFGIPSRKIKILDIYRNEELIASVKPKGLWIIGANGRIDILLKDKAISFIDNAEKYHTPNWVSFLKSNKSKGFSFNKTSFFEILGIKENGNI